MDPYPHPLDLHDADILLEMWGKQLACTAAPAVTRGLVDHELIERPAGEGTTLVRQLVLKVKAGAFDGLTVRNTRVDVTDAYGRTLSYTIDQPFPQGTSLFDAFVLQPRRA